MNNDVSQQNCIGDEQDGNNFFMHQIRQLQVVLSESMRDRHKIEERGVVTVIKKKEEQQRRDYYHSNGRNARQGYRPRQIRWRQKQIIQIPLRNHSEQMILLPRQEIRQEMIHLTQPQSKIQIKQESVIQAQHQSPQIQIKTKQNNIQNSDIAQIGNESNELHQKSNQIMNFGYIDSADSMTSSKSFLDGHIISFLNQTQEQIKSNKQSEKLLIDNSEIICEDCDLQSVTIDLNPKKNIKKPKKDKKRDRPQKILLEKKAQNSLQLCYNNHQSISLRNDPSLLRSFISSQKSINLALSISKLLTNIKIEDFQNAPWRQILVQLNTNGSVDSVRIDSIKILPLERVVEIKQSKKHEKLVQFNQYKYDLPSRQYYQQNRKINLCKMRIPDLPINTIKDEDYYEILGGSIIKLACLRLRCTSCSQKLSLFIKDNTNIGMESCQKCSMTLKIAVNSIIIHPC